MLRSFQECKFFIFDKSFLKKNVRNDSYLKNFFYSRSRKKIRKQLNQLKEKNFPKDGRVDINEGNIKRIQFLMKKENIEFSNLCIEKIQELILKYKGIPLERLILSIYFQLKIFF